MLDINFVDGEYTLYITDGLNAKPTKQIYVPIILTTNTINRAEEREAGRVNYVSAKQQRAVKNARTIIRFVPLLTSVRSIIFFAMNRTSGSRAMKWS